MSTAQESAPWREGQDGRHAVYRERLGVHWIGWAFSILVCATIAVAYGHTLGALGGWVTYVACQGVAGALLVADSPLVRVDERVLRAGRARLPREYVGRVRVLDASTATRLRGPDTDASAYHCTRSWIPGTVAVEVTDPADPHPYWLVSSRDPHALAAALAAIIDPPGAMADPGRGH